MVAADINDDGKLEIVTCDNHGNVAAWNAQGEEIWEVHVKSSIPQAQTIILHPLLLYFYFSSSLLFCASPIQTCTLLLNFNLRS